MTYETVFMTCVIASVFMTVSNIPWVCMYCGHCINDASLEALRGEGGGSATINLYKPPGQALPTATLPHPPTGELYHAPSFLLRPDLKPVVVEPEVTLRCDHELTCPPLLNWCGMIIHTLHSCW